MASTSAEEYILEFTPEEEKAELLRVADPIIKLSIPAACFDRDTAVEMGHTFKAFMKLVKFVASLESVGLLAEAISLGITKVIFLLPTQCTLGEFVKLARYLKTEQGKEDLAMAQLRLKIMQKVTPGVTPKAIALHQVFVVAQRQEFAASLKQTRSRYDEELRQLQIQVRLKEREMKTAINDEYERFRASLFEEPQYDEIEKIAWQLYEEDSRSKGEVPRAKLAGGLSYAVENFGQKARETVEREFAMQEDFAADLQRYLEQRLLSFRETADARQERKAKLQLELIGGDDDPGSSAVRRHRGPTLGKRGVGEF